MILSVPLFGSRISPHFGSSVTVAVYEIQDREIVSKRIEHFGESCGDQAVHLARQIVAFRADILVCGGIQRQCKELLVSKGIKVLENCKGDADQQVASLIESGSLFER
ncbi:MAG: NifB/NifX family molybdenum-iron cluster-binding protein [Desulfohalobiaceae bacterium]